VAKRQKLCGLVVFTYPRFCFIYFRSRSQGRRHSGGQQVRVDPDCQEARAEEHQGRQGVQGNRGHPDHGSHWNGCRLRPDLQTTLIESKFSNTFF